ncbi:PadR family transcriptional regulator [Lysinibacillus sp. KCTC 33748]|uniref:PadR family transcriptional regulator n=1 Tax=unclassified Lysinibacillus TaxID=2636778 RepID=UPI0009A7F03E|nr:MULTISPECIES: PadR family transcriptional regulator [unclassified Lysinibacillus]OXS76066.1 PadR family transcriptional regulator [Lysinibacillus sp. KCTC 33748]SKB39662.1 transcriptional regulator, PadR family [Lysinibacillus sp. AC-3]
MTFQLGSALLDACVLAIVDKEDAYGYSLTQQIQSVMEISESTLYPVLRRLQKADCLTTYDQPYQGRNRRYYQITEQGRIRLLELLKEWQKYKEMVDCVLIGGKYDE